MKAELYFEAKHQLAEGPVWHLGKLWWVDIEAGSLHNDAGESWKSGKALGAAVPYTDTSWIIAWENGFAEWDLKSSPTMIWERQDPTENYRFNDGKLAPDGTFWAGTLKRGTTNGDCSFFSLTKDGKVQQEITELGLCNGLAWDTERDYFYYVDTGSRCLYRRKIDKKGAGDVYFDFGDCAPDGMCLDEDGNAWVALWGRGLVVKIDRVNGTVSEQVSVPAPNTTSCCISEGQLYITTARVGMQAENLKKYPQSGSIFRKAL